MAPKPDVTGASSTATGEESADSPAAQSDSLDFLSQMSARASTIADSGEGAGTPEDGDEAAAGKADAAAKQKAEKDKKPEGKADAKPADGKSEPEMIPKAALEKRVGELTSQKRALRDEVSSSKLENAKLKAALQIAIDEAKHYRERAAAGEPFDEKDDEIRAMKIRDRAREAHAAATRGHEETLSAATEEEAVEEERLKLEDEIGAALAATRGLVDRPELVTEIKKAANRGRSFSEIATELHNKRLALARTHLGVPSGAATTSSKTGAAGSEERPAWPKTAKGRVAGNAAVNRAPDLGSMLARAEELEAHNS